jgi:hypothetical protein
MFGVTSESDIFRISDTDYICIYFQRRILFPAFTFYIIEVSENNLFLFNKNLRYTLRSVCFWTVQV